MSQLFKRRVEGLHREFVEASHKHSNLRFLVVHPHDPLIPWPEFPSGTDGYTTLGLHDNWWHQVLAGLDPGARRYSNLLEPIWLSLERVLWQGVFYVQESQPEGSPRNEKNGAIDDFGRLKAGVTEFFRLASLAANHFEMPSDPFFWDADGILLQAEQSHRWLEKLMSLGLDEPCEGGVTQVRRLKANVFACGARAIEILSDSTLSFLHSRITAADEAWLDGYDQIASTINRVITERGKRPLVSGPSSIARLSLSDCRQRLVDALSELPLRISCSPGPIKSSWQPWALGRIKGNGHPSVSIGSGRPLLADDELSNAEKAWREKPSDWNWFGNAVELIHSEAKQWSKSVRAMRQRANESPLPDEDPSLSETEQAILIEMLMMKALDVNSRRTCSRITSKVSGPKASPEKLKKVFPRLVKLQLIGSQDGRGGGYWLTGGHSLAIKLWSRIPGSTLS
jgi:hypothetical protein